METKFRGQRVGSKEWVYGNINYLADGVFIIPLDHYGKIQFPEYNDSAMGCGLEDRCITDRYEAMAHGWDKALDRQLELLPEFIEVIPETVGQFTGLVLNNIEVYKDDLIRNTVGKTYRVEFINYSWYLVALTDGQKYNFEQYIKMIKKAGVTMLVIGNKWEVL